MPKSIELVLLLRDKEVSKELGAVLWAMFKEVAALFNFDKNRAIFNFTYLSDYVPVNLEGYSLNPSFSNLRDLVMRYFREKGKVDEISETPQFSNVPNDFFEQSSGRFHRTYDATSLQKLIRPVLEGLYKDRPIGSDIVIIYDQEITPPANFNYIIWSNRVISIAPTDPYYWRITDPNRIAMIKHRVRSACLNVVGSLLGLKRCENELCFLYRKVDSVLRLDSMVKLGREHDLDVLTDYGFEILPDNPGSVQPVVKNPQLDLEWMYYE